MAKDNFPVTPAMRVLRAHGVTFTDHPYDYEDRGGTAVSARELGVDEHAVVKTLIMEDDSKRPLVVLMHGDLMVSTKELARAIKVKTISPCAPDTANRHSGYMVGGTSPFATKKPMPIFVERSILDLDRICINGGRRGFLVELAPSALSASLGATPVDVAQER